MNKENIYIEPEDDITDIITKIENSKAKIIALIPPKKAGVFRSVVNIKLIAKAGKSAEKNIVLVTVDPSITKLAATSKLPVAKNLQSAPSIPKLDEDLDNTSTENVDEDGKTEEPTQPDNDTKEEDDSKGTKEEKDDGEEDAIEDESEEDEEDTEDAEDSKKSKKDPKPSKNKLINWVKNHKKLSVLIVLGLIGLISFLIWALFVAPAVNVFVSIKTDTNNFSEAITFVKEQNQEDIKDGKLYLEERKIESVQEVQFDATGQKNVGEKASGTVQVSHSFFGAGSVSINKGTVFSFNNLNYYATEDTTLGWSGLSHSLQGLNESVKNCVNNALREEYCTIIKKIKVVAAQGGTAYNIPASDSGWTSVAQVKVQSKEPMAGGTDHVITVVQQADVEKAKNQLVSANEAENKKKLYASIPTDSLILESTFSEKTSDPTVTPAVDEEVKEDVKPSLKIVTTTSVYIVDKTKLEELIKTKVQLADNKKIFEIRNVYIDGFRESDGVFTGKLKAIYFTGPRMTEAELVDKIKGKGLGDARREISDVEGVAEVKMDPSYPWVLSVPTDSNRITVTFEIKDQNGQTIEEKTTKDQDTNQEAENNQEPKE